MSVSLKTSVRASHNRKIVEYYPVHISHLIVRNHDIIHYTPPRLLTCIFPYFSHFYRRFLRKSERHDDSDNDNNDANSSAE